MQVYWKCEECDECNPYPGRGVCESCGARMTAAAERAALLQREEEKRRLEKKRQRAEEERRKAEEEKRKAEEERRKAEDRRSKEAPKPGKETGEEETPSVEPVWKKVRHTGFPKVFRRLCIGMLLLFALLWIIMVFVRFGMTKEEFVQSGLYDMVYFWIYEAEIILCLEFLFIFAAALLLLHIYIAAPSKRKPLPEEHRLHSLAEEAYILIQCYYMSLWLTAFNYFFWNNEIGAYILRLYEKGADYGFELVAGSMGNFCIIWFVMYLPGIAVRAAKVPEDQKPMLKSKGEESPYAILQIVSKAGRYSLFCGVLFVLALIFFG